MFTLLSRVQAAFERLIASVNRVANQFDAIGDRIESKDVSSPPVEVIEHKKTKKS